MKIDYLILSWCTTVILALPKPESQPSVNLAPGPFGALDNLNPPRPVGPDDKVFIPPDIKYWAYGKVNTTIVDAGGLPWYCYTYRQTHCRPLFDLPAKWRTTRRPFVSSNPARSTTTAPLTTTRPPVTIVRTNVDGDLFTQGVTISNRGRKLVGTASGGVQFNHFTTEMPSYAEAGDNTTPDTTEIYSFFGQPGFHMLNTSGYAKKEQKNEASASVSYSTVIVHSPSPKPLTDNSIRTTRYASMTTPMPQRKNDKFGEAENEEDMLEDSSIRNNDKYLVEENQDGDSSEGSSLPWPFTVPRTEVNDPDGPTVILTPFKASSTERLPRTTEDTTTEKQRLTTTLRTSTTTVENDRRDRDRAIKVTASKPKEFFGSAKVTNIDANIETQATLTLNYSLQLTTSTTTTTTTTTTTVTTTTETTTTTEDPKNVELAPAFTVYGEACRDACVTRGYSYTWCNKRRLSRIGTWSDSDHCTPKANITSTGDNCIDACLRRGQQYYWCHKETTLWGFCTPDFLIQRTARYVGVVDETRVEPPEGYTIRGEACRDKCDYHGYAYTWCQKVTPSNLGNWRNSDYCSNEPNITSDGQICKDECAFRGYSYAWCHTEESWGYCTPASFLSFLSRLHINGPVQPPVLLTNVSFDNLDRDRLLVEDKDANIIESLPIPSTTDRPLSSTTSEVLVSKDPEPVRTFDVSQFIEDYDNEQPASSGGINDEINAATDANSDKYPRYYRRALGFTVFGESCYDTCEIRDGYEYTWCHKFKESATGTWSDADYCTTESNKTPFGEDCIDKCAKRGQSYYWCHKETTLWGFCTPDHLIEQLEQNQVSRELLLLSFG